MKKAFIFDLDGTLLDSMGMWANFGFDYLTAKGVVEIPENLREILTPLSLLEAADYFKIQFGLSQSARTICEEINAMLAHKYKHEVELKPDALDFLTANTDCKMCIATATDKHLVESALERLGIDPYFEFVITSSEVGNSKQNPDIYLQAASRLGVEISDCIVFEDALHAIRSASSAGFHVVGVYEPFFESDLETIKCSAHSFVHTLKEFSYE